jgi:acetyl-CoA carboxylase biotin carboxyl carrier protein
MKLADIQKIIKDFEASSLTELELEFEDSKIKLSKNQLQDNKPATVVSQTPKLIPNASTPSPSLTEDHTFRSPLVGTYYAASSPKAKAFVEQGQKVSKGDVLCIIEAMKIMNEITAPKEGTILKVHAMNGQVVGINDALFDIG